MIASHYAEPVERRLGAKAELKSAPSDQAETIAELPAGERFALLDDSQGWAWGYAGDGGRVGYVASAALA